MSDRIKVAVLYGGPSEEHEVSVTSARGVLTALDRNKYEPIPIGISRQGEWVIPEVSPADMPLQHGTLPAVDASRGKPGGLQRVGSDVVAGDGAVIDVVFPVLHGTGGEDGSIQGFLEILGLPFVGSGVGASAAAISKNTTKLLLQQAGIPVVDWVTVTDARAATPELTQAAEKLGYPVFVKPDAQGSSVGVHRVADSTELHDAVVDAARYDGRALIERAMTGFIEVECAVLGNHDPQASVLGEITPCNEFYDYEAKYLAEGSVLTIPARVPDETAERIRDLAVKAFKVLGCAGLARVDFFANDTDVFCNEVNTMPGFTPISMYPKLWEASGVSYSELLDRLVQLALEPPVHGHE